MDILEKIDRVINEDITSLAHEILFQRQLQDPEKRTDLESVVQDTANAQGIDPDKLMTAIQSIEKKRLEKAKKVNIKVNSEFIESTIGTDPNNMRFVMTDIERNAGKYSLSTAKKYSSIIKKRYERRGRRARFKLIPTEPNY